MLNSLELDNIILELKTNKISSQTKEYINSLFFSYKQDIPSDIDFIVVLGGNSSHRPKTAAIVYHKTKKPVICSGGGKLKYKGIEAYWYKRILLKHDVLEKDIIIEEKSKNSYENIKFTLPMILKRKNKPKILFISSVFHLPRMNHLIKLEKEINYYEFEYYLYPSYSNILKQKNWFKHEETRLDFALEISKLREYGIIKEGYMREYLESLVTKEVYPGCNYAIIHDTIEKGSIGLRATIPNKEPNAIDVLYDMASLSKVIVTVTILTKLIESGKLSFQDKVKDYLKDYQYDSTIFDLMTHTSGLAADFPLEKVCSLKNKEDLIHNIYQEPLAFEPKTDVVYSDFGYLLLGLIIEKIYNKPLDMVAKEELFMPLGMEQTTYCPSNKEFCAPTEVTEIRGVVRGTVHDEKASLMNGVCGTAGVFSNLDNTIKFVNMILNDGMIDGKRFLSKEMIELWNTPLVTGKDGVQRSFCWVIGHGRVAGHSCSETVMSFTGFTGPTIVIDRENNLSFVLLTNRIHPTRENKLLLDERGKIMDKICEQYLKQDLQK